VRDIPLVVGDVADRELVARTLRDHRVQAVIHFAALKSVEDSLRDPVGYFRANVAATLALVEAMTDAEVPLLVNSSSCAVYGTPASLPVDELAPFRPDNPYGETKATTERLLSWISSQTGLRAMSLRYFNAAGATLDASNGEDPRGATNLIPIVMAAALGRRGPVIINGTDYDTPDGTAIRDYVHVLDLAAAHVRAVEHLLDGGAPTTLNLGTGRGASVREIIELTRRASGRTIPVVEGPRRVGDPPVMVADASRALDTIGWRAEHDVESMVDSAWRWHEGHPGGFDD
jgi:UDP-glucose-4-epimerase GalE